MLYQLDNLAEVIKHYDNVLAINPNDIYISNNNTLTQMISEIG
jgi:hypothetical protein